MAPSYRFDPRKNSAVTLRFVEKVPTESTLLKSKEVSVKSFTVGPHVGGSLQSLTLPDCQPEDPHPPFLERDGNWSPHSPQKLFTQTLNHSPRAKLSNHAEIQPVASVHSYYDASPVNVHDMVCEGIIPGATSTRKSLVATPRDGGWNHRPVTALEPMKGTGGLNGSGVGSQLPESLRMAASARRPTPMRSSQPTVPAKLLTSQPKSLAWAPTLTAGASHPSTSPGPLPSALEHSTREASKQPDEWNPYTATLKMHDLEREQNLSQTVVPGSANCRLVGGKWRYIPANAPGDPVYTDYYGRFAGSANNYYGRSYHTTTNQFAKNKLVEDKSYARVQASMPGISDLRFRPGMALRTTLQNGPTSQLGSPNIHQISDFYRMRATVKA